MTVFNFHRWKQRGSLYNCCAKSIVLSLDKIANRLIFDIQTFLGRTLFTILVITSVLLTFVAPESSVPSGNLYEILGWLAGVLDGAMLAILYLTKIKGRF